MTYSNQTFVTGQSKIATTSRRSSLSLAAVATINNADNHHKSASTNPRPLPQPHIRQVRQRQSQAAMHFNLFDDATASPGEVLPSSDSGHFHPPSHHRHANLGELHYEIEMEQEAQVNRMLLLIREQQYQLETLQKNQQEHVSARLPPTHMHSSNSVAIDDSTPQNERLITFPTLPQPIRRDSRPYNPSSDNRSPVLRPHDTFDWPPSPSDTSLHNSLHRNNVRDSLNNEEAAYYKAKTAVLTRENQLLRIRLRELEKQLHDTHTTIYPNTPPTHSHLSTTTLVSPVEYNTLDEDLVLSPCVSFGRKV